MSKITKEIEDLIIQKYNDGITCRKIGVELNLAHATVSSILKKNNVSVELYNKFATPKIIHQEIIQSYKNKELDTYELAKKYKVSVNSIRNLLIKNNIEMRSKSERMRQYNVDESFFDIINTQEKAYILGFLYADAYNNEYSIILNLHNKDTDILNEISNIMKYEGPLLTNKENQAILCISSIKLCKRLTELGCFKCKSLTLKFPSKDIIPDNLLHHFIRGYMDGDGCIAIDKRNQQGNLSFVGSYDFIDSLQDIFINKFGYTGYKRTKNKIKELVYGGQNQSLTLLDWLYNDATIFLKRKYDKYLLIKNRPNKRKN